MKRLSFLVLFAVLVPLGGFAADDWDWGMAPEVYKGLEFSERSAVDRAVKLFATAWNAERRGARSFELVPQYRAAAAEWRKVQIQAESANVDESLIAYTIFMQGFSRMKAHDSLEAVKLFKEAADFYEDLTWVAFAARFWLAQTKLDMGETKSGLILMEALLDEEDAAKHALMGTVLARAGWRRWYDCNEAEAQELWRKGADPVFYAKNRHNWQSSRQGIRLACAVCGDFPVFEESIFEGVREDDHNRRADILRDNANWMMNELNRGDSAVNTYFRKKHPVDRKRDEEIKSFRKRFLAWFDKKRGEFAAAGREFEFDVLNVRMHCGYETKEQLHARIGKLISTLNGLKDAAKVSGRVRSIIRLFYDLHEWDEALMMVDRIKDPLESAWLRYEVCEYSVHRGAKGDWWGRCVKALEDFLKLKPGERETIRAKYALARISRDRVGNPKRALKIFLDIADPPSSLWELVTTYRILDDKQKANSTLEEIVSMFPDHAPRAVWTLAQFAEKDGDKKKAVALYRRLLSQPEWKKSRESSQAHQALERLGERTGGAMTNEVR